MWMLKLHTEHRRAVISSCDSYFEGPISVFIGHSGWSRTSNILTFISTSLHNHSLIIFIANVIDYNLCKW
jgi:hypothetical protein